MDGLGGVCGCGVVGGRDHWWSYNSEGKRGGDVCG